MKPRCQGAKTPGHFTSFECRLDADHDGHCEPYVPPTVDEWRAMRADIELWRAESIASRDMLESGDIEAPWRAEVGRLQAEVDALRAIIASGCDACAHGTPRV